MPEDIEEGARAAGKVAEFVVGMLGDANSSKKKPPTVADGKIHKLVINDTSKSFLGSEEEKKSEKKAKEIVKHLKDILKQNPNAKMTIVYDANEQETIKEVEKLLTEEQKQRFHPIPINIQSAILDDQKTDSTTTLGISSIQLQMLAIAKKLGEGEIVLSLCNQKTQDNEHITLKPEARTTKLTADGKEVELTEEEQQKVTEFSAALIEEAQKYMTFMAGEENKKPNLEAPSGASQEEDEFKFLKEEYQKAKNPKPQQSPLEPLANPEDWPEAGEKAISAHQVMESITLTEWEQHEPLTSDQLYFNATAEDNTEHKQKNYTGTIYDKPATESGRKALVHITPQGLVCPEVSEEQKPAQAKAIANSLSLMASKAPNPPEPLEVNIKGFSAAELQIILPELEKKNVKIKFTINDKESPDILKLLTDFNEKQTNGNNNPSNTSGGTLSPIPPSTSPTTAPAAKPSAIHEIPQPEPIDSADIPEAPTGGPLKSRPLRPSR